MTEPTNGESSRFREVPSTKSKFNGCGYVLAMSACLWFIVLTAIHMAYVVLR